MLSAGSKSPLQLAKLSNTSVANISQQLRLLEMAGLVQSKRISNRDRGQPRLLYSLVGNHSFLISSSKDFVEKKFLQLSDYNKVILKIWFLEDTKTHYYLEKAFWFLEDHISRMEAILLDNKALGAGNLQLIILSNGLALDKVPKKLRIKNPSGISKEVSFVIQTPEIFAKSPYKPSDYYSLYDPSNIANAAVLDFRKNDKTNL